MTTKSTQYISVVDEYCILLTRVHADDVTLYNVKPDPYSSVSLSVMLPDNRVLLDMSLIQSDIIVCLSADSEFDKTTNNIQYISVVDEYCILLTRFIWPTNMLQNI